ncbi:MAG: toll/interleukin-1 receptor domain-containing protein [Clostridia bacterium]|nr:toll/interleukin-1 receptor domain-containing protein [Clostridia bacterium]
MRVFLSYSWDSDAHREWVVKIANTLRNPYGFDARCDGTRTIDDLNRMMVEEIRDSDKIIVVATRQYAEKADGIKGGVGTETQLLFNYFVKNPSKIVVIKKEDTELPFYLNGFQYIDFTQGDFVKNIEQLVLKLQDSPQYEPAPIAKNPKKVTSKHVDIDDDLIPNLTRYAREDKQLFLEQQLEQAHERIMALLQKTQSQYPDFSFSHKEIDESVSAGRSWLLNGQMIERKTQYKGHMYQISFLGESNGYRLWVPNGEDTMGIYGSSDLGRYGRPGYNSYQLWIGADQSEKVLALNATMGVYGEKISNGKDLGEFVFKQMTWRLR